MTEDKSRVKSDQCLRLFSSRRQPPLLVFNEKFAFCQFSMLFNGNRKIEHLAVTVTGLGKEYKIGLFETSSGTGSDYQ